MGFAIPGITMIKLKKKPATKAGKRMAFGKEVFVKAKPARTLVKCYTVKALKAASELELSSSSGHGSWRSLLVVGLSRGLSERRALRPHGPTQQLTTDLFVRTGFRSRRRNNV